MFRILSLLLGSLLVLSQLPAQFVIDDRIEQPETVSEEAAESAEAGTIGFEKPDGPLDMYIIPIERQIDNATLAIVLRALEAAEANGIDLIVLRMDTPGGRLDMTQEIMEALDAFEGLTMTFIADDALSAGAYISASTDEIYMTPKGIIGAAAVIAGTGEDIPVTIKQKIDSVMKAKVRTLDRGYRYRADVIRAMMDSEFELEIEGEVLKTSGELLSLTGEEAAKKYGSPPQPLLSLGTYEDIDAMLADRFGEGGVIDRNFELNWAEELAFKLNAVSPLIFSAGFLLLLIELKTPGFGLFGGLGIGVLIFVFVSQFVSGFAGHEPLILFVVGVLLALVEVFLIPGTFIAGITGVGLMAGSLVWAMIGVLPPMDDIDFSIGVISAPINDILLGLAIAVAPFLAILRFLPKSMFWDKIVLSGAVGGGNSPQTAKEVGAVIGNVKERPEIGAKGFAATDMLPSGSVEIDGKRFEAQSQRGTIRKGEEISVTGYASYSLIVKSLTVVE